MDYSDATVIIPVKDEPAAGRVARQTLRELPGSSVIVIYKGDFGALNLNFKDKRLRVIEQIGSGKGTACMQAVKHVRTRIACFIDGDATYDVRDLRKVIGLVRGGADMAMGDRLSALNRSAMPAIIELGNRVITVTADLLYGMRFRDTQTGLRAFRKAMFDSLGIREKYFGIESEMTIKASKRGYKVLETPIRYYSRVGESKQMKFMDGIKLLLLDFKFLFS